MIKIREATPKDNEALINLNLELIKFEKAFEPDLKIDDETKKFLDEWITKDFKSKDWKSFVAEDNGEIVGFISGRIGKRYKFYKTQVFGDAENAFVIESYRNKGVAKQLMAELVVWMKSKGVERIEASTYWKNTAAQDIWRKMGFKEHMIIFEKRI